MATGESGSPDVLPTVPDRSRGWVAGFAGLLVVAMAVATFPQFAIGILAPFMTEEFGLSRTALGVLSAVFFAVGTVGAPIVGPLVDVFGGRRALYALFAVLAIAFGSMGMAPSFPWLLVGMAIAGIAGAASNPVTNTLIVTEMPPGRRGAITGVKQSGVQVGAFLAGALLPASALLFGWRGSFVVPLILCVVGAVLAAATKVQPVEQPVRDRQPEVAALGSIVWWIAAYAFLMGAGVAAVNVYLPLYAFEAMGFSVRAAGMTAGLIGLIAIGARIAWARMAEQVIKSSGPLAYLAMISVAAQLVVVSSIVLGAWALWTGVALLGLSAAAWNGVANLAIIRDVRVGTTGRATGIVQASFSAGLMLSPIAFGYSVDQTGAYTIGWLGVAGLFVAASLLMLRWRYTHAP